MYRLQVKTHFDAAHYIKDYQGKCSRMHGHRWEVEVVLEGGELDKMNILIDFGVVKGMLETLVGKLDHYVLNEVLQEHNVTAEFLAKWFYKEFYQLYQLLISDSAGWVEFRGMHLTRVTIWESPDCCVKYFGEE